VFHFPQGCGVDEWQLAKHLKTWSILQDRLSDILIAAGLLKKSIKNVNQYYFKNVRFNNYIY
jgi:hypothetical protein